MKAYTAVLHFITSINFMSVFLTEHSKLWLHPEHYVPANQQEKRQFTSVTCKLKKPLWTKISCVSWVIPLKGTHIMLSWSTQWIICLHLSLFLPFSSVTPTLYMSSCFTSINLLFCLFLLPDSRTNKGCSHIQHLLFNICTASVLCTYLNHLSLPSLTFVFKMSLRFTCF